jgi:hypothetical protein
MRLTTFLNNVSFRFFGPESKLPWYRRLAHRLARVKLSLESLNTRLPRDRQAVRPVLRTLCQIPRMSTYALGAVIDKLVSEMPARRAASAGRASPA